MTSKLVQIGRRGFIAKGAAVFSVLATAKAIAQPGFAVAQVPATEPIDPTSPQAAALGYSHDATKVDTAKFAKRAGPEGAKQLCSNCMFYSQGGQKVGGKDGEWGACMLFPGKLVNAAGWCNSWAPKPA